MRFLQGNRNQLKKVLRPDQFARLGIRADYAEPHTIKLTRCGKQFGQIRKSIGKFNWYSADTGRVELSAFSPEQLLSRLSQRI